MHSRVVQCNMITFWSLFLLGVSLFVALKVYIKVYHLLKGDGSDQLSGVTDSKSQSKEREELQLKQSTIKPITQERCLYKEEPTVSTEM